MSWESLGYKKKKLGNFKAILRQTNPSFSSRISNLVNCYMLWFRSKMFPQILFCSEASQRWLDHRDLSTEDPRVELQLVDMAWLEEVVTGCVAWEGIFLSPASRFFLSLLAAICQTACLIKPYHQPFPDLEPTVDHRLITLKLWATLNLRVPDILS